MNLETLKSIEEFDQALEKGLEEFLAKGQKGKKDDHKKPL